MQQKYYTCVCRNGFVDIFLYKSVCVCVYMHERMYISILCTSKYDGHIYMSQVIEN